ncbi:MAG: hypothetical protein P8N02_02665 [Actinomycetota bacterium]|nr:hypothetical protein [Actinomycetota bacterium]
MTVIDHYGLEMHADDADALSRHERLVQGYLMFEADMVERMADAVAPGLDDSPPLTSIVHAQLMAMSHSPLLILTAPSMEAPV